MHAYPPSARRALLAGHAASDVRTVRDILGRLGIDRIEAVADGKAAIAALAARPPDMLVLAWDIEAANAEAVISAARNSAKAGSKIVVTMAAPTPAIVEAAKGLQVDSIIASPFSPRAFMDRLPRFVPDAGGHRA